MNRVGPSAGEDGLLRVGGGGGGVPAALVFSGSDPSLISLMGIAGSSGRHRQPDQIGMPRFG